MQTDDMTTQGSEQIAQATGVDGGEPPSGAEGEIALAFPTGRDAAAIYLISGILLIFLGSRFQGEHLLFGLVVSEIMFVSSPALLYTLASRHGLRETFHLNPISLKTAGLSILIACPAFVVMNIAALAQEWLFPRSAIYQQYWETFFARFQQFPFVVAIAMIAALPGICEELLFRGFLLRGMRRQLPAPAAVALTGVLFGAFHLDPYRFLPTSLLGMLFGCMVIRTGSILPGMIAHAANNTIALTLSMTLYKLRDLPSRPDETLLTWRHLLAAVPTAALAGWLVWRGLRALPPQPAES